MKDPNVKAPIRGMVVATAVVAVSTAPTLGATALADNEALSQAPVERSRPVAVAVDVAIDPASPKPSGATLARLAEKQRREAARKKAAREARQVRAARAAEKRASRSSRRVVTSGDARGIAAGMAARTYGWGSEQFACLDSLWERESGWSVTAANPSSGAYGIPQALPGSKMGAYGSDWQSNPATQIAWGLDYIDGRYGTPCAAWSTFRSQGWY